MCDQVLCVGKESTFEFLFNVLDEICELFPSEYIHIGGDECPKKEWDKCPICQAKMDELGLVADEKGTRGQKLQNYVTKRVQEHLATKGRKIIGWDEILEGELGAGATVMSWRGCAFVCSDTPPVRFGRTYLFLISFGVFLSDRSV